MPTLIQLVIASCYVTQAAHAYLQVRPVGIRVDTIGGFQLHLFGGLFGQKKETTSTPTPVASKTVSISMNLLYSYGYVCMM